MPELRSLAVFISQCVIFEPAMLGLFTFSMSLAAVNLEVQRLCLAVDYREEFKEYLGKLATMGWMALRNAARIDDVLGVYVCLSNFLFGICRISLTLTLAMPVSSKRRMMIYPLSNLCSSIVTFVRSILVKPAQPWATCWSCTDVL